MQPGASGQVHKTANYNFWYNHTKNMPNLLHTKYNQDHADHANIFMEMTHLITSTLMVNFETVDTGFKMCKNFLFH